MLSHLIDTVTDQFGNGQANSHVTIKVAGTNTLATLYSDIAGLTPIANPTAADTYGNIDCYVAAGTYDITYGSGSSSATKQNVELLASSGGSGASVISAADYGTFGDGNSHLLVSADITRNLTKWAWVGKVNTSGTAVTWVSGAKFYKLAMAGANITINGVAYTIASVGASSGGVSTTMTLTTSAGTQVGVPYAAYAVGDEWDYVGIQEAYFAAFGAPGSEHSTSNSGANRPLSIPAGTFRINRTLLWTHTFGADIRGAGNGSTKLLVTTANTPLVYTNGLAFSYIYGITFQQGASSNTCTFCLDYDGDFSNWNGALQSNEFDKVSFTAEGYTGGGYGLWVAPSSFMGSEMSVHDSYFAWYTGACYRQTGFNALNNRIQNNNWINCSGNGIHAVQGNVYVTGNAFQNGSALSAPAQVGYDVRIDNSAYDTSYIGWNRSESSQFVQIANGHKATIEANHQTGAPLAYVWSANAVIGDKGLIVGTYATAQLDTSSGYYSLVPRYAVTVPCTLGGAEPPWSQAASDVTSGTCTLRSPANVFAHLGGSPARVLGNQMEMGQVLGVSGESQQLESNFSFRRDWFGTNASGAPFSTAFPDITEVDNKVIYPGPGGPAIQLKWDYAANGNTIFDYAHNTRSSTPIIWTANAPSGGFYWQVGLGPGNLQPGSAADATAIVALLKNANGVGPVLGMQDAVGSNIAGSDLFLGGGRSTGTGLGGKLHIQISPVGGAGSAINALADATIFDTGGMMTMTGRTFATLGTPANGSIVYCSDCTVANPCANGGTGALAKRLNGAWVCN